MPEQQLPKSPRYAGNTRARSDAVGSTNDDVLANSTPANVGGPPAGNAGRRVTANDNTQPGRRSLQGPDEANGFEDSDDGSDSGDGLPGFDEITPEMMAAAVDESEDENDEGSDEDEDDEDDSSTDEEDDDRTPRESPAPASAPKRTLADIMSVGSGSGAGATGASKRDKRPEGSVYYRCIPIYPGKGLNEKEEVRIYGWRPRHKLQQDLISRGAFEGEWEIHTYQVSVKAGQRTERLSDIDHMHTDVAIEDADYSSPAMPIVTAPVSTFEPDEPERHRSVPDDEDEMTAALRLALEQNAQLMRMMVEKAERAERMHHHSGGGGGGSGITFEQTLALLKELREASPKGGMSSVEIKEVFQAGIDAKAKAETPRMGEWMLPMAMMFMAGGDGELKRQILGMFTGSTGQPPSGQPVQQTQQAPPPLPGQLPGASRNLPGPAPAPAVPSAPPEPETPEAFRRNRLWLNVQRSCSTGRQRFAQPMYWATRIFGEWPEQAIADLCGTATPLLAAEASTSAPSLIPIAKTMLPSDKRSQPDADVLALAAWVDTLKTVVVQLEASERESRPTAS